jgi:transposase
VFNFNDYEILAYSEPVDMRKSFSGLIGIVCSVLKEDPLEARLYLFFNKRRNYLKLLFWDRTGYCLICKKLERGGFAISGNKINLQQLKLLFDGINIGIKK